MFFHVKQLQYNAKPERPDPLFAMKLQEVLGGQWGEMSVALGYLFQGWNCRGPAKYRDMLMDIATEELAHVEMLAVMISRLLEGAPVSMRDAAVEQHPAIAAVMGGMNPQHAIVSGLGATPTDSVGYPWTARYIVASGNLLADFRYNVTAESQGRLQVSRLWNMTEDKGVRDMLAFNMARDTMHQNQWLAAIEELKADGLEETPCPSSWPQEQEHQRFSYQFWDLSEGKDSQQGRWAQGKTPDGKGQFEYLGDPKPQGEALSSPAAPADPRLYSTPMKPGEPKR
jgi:Mn-containing catalase